MIRIVVILKFVVCLCLSLIFSVAIGQDTGLKEKGGTLRGHITGRSPQQNPIEGVRVVIAGTNGEIFTVYTNEEGYYEKTGIAMGRYAISTYKEGYRDRVGKIGVVSSSDG